VTPTQTETLPNRILYWDFSNTSSYSGTSTVFDLENNSNGTIMNSPTSGGTGCGTYIDFNGTSQYIYTNTDLSPLFSGVSPNKSEVTSIFMWIYPQGDGVIVSEVGVSNSLLGWHTSILEMVSGTLKFGLWNGTANSVVTSSISTPLNNWYYVGMTYDGSTLTAYVDGVSAGTVTFNRQAPYNVGSNGLFYLLAHQDGTNMGDGGFGDYQIGSFEVYTTSLSSSQITSNYNNSSSNYICTTPTPTPTLTSTPTNTPTPSATPSIVSSGLVIQLDAYESSSYPGTGTTVFDITGGYDHTLIGATYTVLNGIKCFDCTTGNNRVNYNLTGPTLPNSGYTYITWARLIPSNTVFRTLLYTNGATKITPITIPNETNTLGYWDTAFRSSGYDLSGQTSVWVQYAIVGTNSSQKFYINGSEVGSQIAFGSGGNTHWGWGNNDIVAQPWGHVANMYFYNRQLNLSEITQQYNYLAPRFVEPTPTPTVTPTNTNTPTNTLTPTPSATPNIVTSNLQLQLLPSSYVGSGTVWDTTVGSTDATLSGSPTYNALSGFTFNGSSSYGRIPSVNGVTNFTNSDQYTVEIWFNPANGQPNSGEAELLEKWNLNNESRYPYTIRFDENNSSMLVAAFDGVNFPLVNVTGFTVNTWVQLVAIFDFVSDTLTVYRNGVSGGTTSLAGVGQVSNTSPVGIAGRVAQGTGALQVPFKGTVGIIRMYDASLSSSQVLQNFNYDKNKFGL
jgi:hypothetical protein